MPGTDVFEANALNDRMTGRVDIMGIVWVGPTQAGDRVVVRRTGGARLWEGLAAGTDTYLGIRFPDGFGVLANEGIEFEALDSGRIYLYYRRV